MRKDEGRKKEALYVLGDVLVIVGAIVAITYWVVSNLPA